MSTGSWLKEKPPISLTETSGRHTPYADVTLSSTSGIEPVKQFSFERVGEPCLSSHARASMLSIAQASRNHNMLYIFEIRHGDATVPAVLLHKTTAKAASGYLQAPFDAARPLTKQIAPVVYKQSPVPVST